MSGVQNVAFAQEGCIMKATQETFMYYKIKLRTNLGEIQVNCF